MTSPDYDSLLAKVIGHAPTFDQAAARTGRALAEFRIEGVATNIAVLRALLDDPVVLGRRSDDAIHPETCRDPPRTRRRVARCGCSNQRRGRWLRRMPSRRRPRALIVAPLQATVGSIEVAAGDIVRAGQTLAILEAMKMEHVVESPIDGRVLSVSAERGRVVDKGQVLLVLAPELIEGEADEAEAEVDLDLIRPDLAEVLDRWDSLMDEARPEAVGPTHGLHTAPSSRPTPNWPQSPAVEKPPKRCSVQFCIVRLREIERGLLLDLV